MLSSTNVFTLLVAIVALSSGVHAEQEEAQTFGGGLPGMGGGLSNMMPGMGGGMGLSDLAKMIPGMGGTSGTGGGLTGLSNVTELHGHWN
jgi:hypothetical protein